MAKYNDINLVHIHDGYGIDTIATIKKNDNGEPLIDYTIRSVDKLKIVKVWPHLIEKLEKNNIDLSSTFDDVKNKLPLYRISEGKYYEIAYAFEYYYISEPARTKNCSYECINDIDFIITSNYKLAFKTKEDLDKAIMILTLVGIENDKE